MEGCRSKDQRNQAGWHGELRQHSGQSTISATDECEIQILGTKKTHAEGGMASR